MTRLSIANDRALRWLPLMTVTLLGGCVAGRGPQLFPLVPTERRVLADGGVARGYDIDRDGRVDFVEQLSADGIIQVLHYDTNADGRLDLDVALSGISPDERRDLIILLDSVPFEVVQSAYEHGRLRMFHRPTRVISPFPVMTDLCFSEFFGITPSPGVESQYYNGQTLIGGLSTYLGGGNAAWLRKVDYHMQPLAHASAYMDSHPWFMHELGQIERLFFTQETETFVGYCVGTSALGAQYGRNGHYAALIALDRFCQSVLHRTRGRVRITLLSDHGHNLVQSERALIPEMLRQVGYRVTKRLQRAGDIVVPQFGVVTCAAIHTKSPERVASDVIGIEGVDLAAYVGQSGDVIVLSRGGSARISRSQPAAKVGDAADDSNDDEHDGRGGDGVRYRYVTQRGDPLSLIEILSELKSRGLVDADGFIADRDLLQATLRHTYPDGVHRLWRAFHGLIEHPPDVMVSISDGWHTGSVTIAKIRIMHATHGNLNELGSTGFAMTTAGELPADLRMEDLRTALLDRGVRFVSEGRAPAMARR